MTVEDDIRAIFRGAGATGFLHAREIGGPSILQDSDQSGLEDSDRFNLEHSDGTGREVAVDADAPVVLASTFKIPVAVAFERAVTAGEIDPAERTTVTARYRRGGVGLAGLHDDATLSWRDLAHLMLTVSDNAATDVVFHRVGQAAVDRVLSDLGLHRTRIRGCCGDLFDSVNDDLGIRDDDDIDALLASQPAERLWALSVLDPARTTASTPREMTALIAAIWSDRAASPEACARVRATMGHQVWPHRLRSGFPDEVQVAAKTGTLPATRNEVGAVTHPDGRTFAVAVFTRADTLEHSQPDIDRAIGTAARRAVDALRDED